MIAWATQKHAVKKVIHPATAVSPVRYKANVASTVLGFSKYTSTPRWLRKATHLRYVQRATTATIKTSNRKLEERDIGDKDVLHGFRLCFRATKMCAFQCQRKSKLKITNETCDFKWHLNCKCLSRALRLLSKITNVLVTSVGCRALIYKLDTQ
jgi:hypothetical protein